MVYPGKDSYDSCNTVEHFANERYHYHGIKFSKDAPLKIRVIRLDDQYRRGFLRKLLWRAVNKQENLRFFTLSFFCIC